MSAQEIIEKIKTLPTEERSAVARYLAEHEVREAGANASRNIRPGFHQAVEEMFNQYDELFRELAK